MTETRVDVVVLASQLLKNAYRAIEEAHHLLYPEASALVAAGDFSGLEELAQKLPEAPTTLEVVDLRRELEKMVRILMQRHATPQPVTNAMEYIDDEG